MLIVFHCHSSMYAADVPLRDVLARFHQPCDNCMYSSLGRPVTLSNYLVGIAMLPLPGIERSPVSDFISLAITVCIRHSGDP